MYALVTEVSYPEYGEVLKVIDILNSGRVVLCSPGMEENRLFDFSCPPNKVILNNSKELLIKLKCLL